MSDFEDHTPNPVQLDLFPREAWIPSLVHDHAKLVRDGITFDEGWQSAAHEEELQAMGVSV